MGFCASAVLYVRQPVVMHGHAWTYNARLDLHAMRVAAMLTRCGERQRCFETTHYSLPDYAPRSTGTRCVQSVQSCHSKGSASNNLAR